MNNYSYTRLCHCCQRAPVGNALSSSGTSQLGMFDLHATTTSKYYDHIVLLYLESRKCRTERRFHSFKFPDGYKSTMDWCSVYSTPQGFPKYIYLSPPLIFPTTYGIRTKTRPVWIIPGAAPIRWMGQIRNPRWEQKRTEGYVIVSMWVRAAVLSNKRIYNWYLLLLR
jgi:hypothetical protein